MKAENVCDGHYPVVAFSGKIARMEAVLLKNNITKEGVRCLKICKQQRKEV